MGTKQLFTSGTETFRGWIDDAILISALGLITDGSMVSLHSGMRLNQTASRHSIFCNFESFEMSGCGIDSTEDNCPTMRVDYRL